MKYKTEQLPLGSRERAVEQLRNNDISKAFRTLKVGNLPLSAIEAELTACLDGLMRRQLVGPILSAYYQVGTFGSYSVPELLCVLSTKRDMPTLLKQAYRFGVHEGFEDDIERAIQWHETRGLPDAYAWRTKFAKLAEQRNLATSPPIATVQADDSNSVVESATVFRLRPIKASGTSKVRPSEPDPSDPYIVSQTARSKVEKANSNHRLTLDALVTHLRRRGCDPHETNLIDAYAILHGKPAVFEVKSITEDNEREQVRRAVSQLYEYRYLYALMDASLWVVFSQKPASNWLVEYLTKDRDINVLWVNEAELDGPSKSST